MNTLDPTLLDQISTSILVLEKDLRIEYLNEPAQAFFQESQKRLQGMRLDVLFPDQSTDESMSGIVACCRRAQTSGQPLKVFDSEALIRQSGRVVKFDCQITPVNPLHSDKLVLEITGQEESHVRFVRDQSNPSGQMLVRSLAHEIRNPLGGIRGAAQLLGNELRGKGYEDYIGIIIRETDRLQRLVSRMQASGTASHRSLLNVHTVLEQVRHLVQGHEGGAYTVSTDYDPSLPSIQGDHDQLVQVFLNLLKNAETAVRATEDAGRIVLRTRIDKQLLPNGRCPEQVIRVQVEDNGIGIAPELIDHVFEPLTSGSSTGTGLGLSICREIVGHHGGLISIESELGRTIVNVFLKTAGPENDL